MNRTALRAAAALLLLCLAACLAGIPARAAEQEIRPVILDDADLLTEAEEAALEEKMLPVCEFCTPVFWTTLESGNYRKKAEALYYRTLGNASGVLLVIDMKERQLTVLADGAAHRVITDGESETITDNIYRMAGREQYFACAEEAFAEILKLLRGEQIARPMKLISSALLAVTLALLGLWIFIKTRYETRPKTGKINAALPVTAAGAALFAASLTNGNSRMTKQKKTDLSSHSSGGGRSGGGFSGGGRSGGGFSGGGHSGGGFSGGGGSHRF